MLYVTLTPGEPRYLLSFIFVLRIHECKIRSLRGQIPSENVSLYLRIQYLRSKIVGRIYRE